jgi:hypothetical protein
VKLDPTAEEEEDLATAVVANEDKETDHKAEHIERVYLDLDDGASTLVGGEYGEKEVDMEVSDSEAEEQEEEVQEANGLRRKRTIRVIIRSRAFL